MKREFFQTNELIARMASMRRQDKMGTARFRVREDLTQSSLRRRRVRRREYCRETKNPAGDQTGFLRLRVMADRLSCQGTTAGQCGQGQQADAENREGTGFRCRDRRAIDQAGDCERGAERIRATRGCKKCSGTESTTTDRNGVGDEAAERPGECVFKNIKRGRRAPEGSDFIGSEHVGGVHRAVANDAEEIVNAAAAGGQESQGRCGTGLGKARDSDRWSRSAEVRNGYQQVPRAGGSAASVLLHNK
jgi:hypothetical protein